jgi:hypothetical protein
LILIVPYDARICKAEMFHDVYLSRLSLKFYSAYPETIPVTTVNINESPRIDGRKPWKALVPEAWGWKPFFSLQRGTL